MAAHRIAFFAGLFDFLAHGRYAVRVNAAQLIPLNLFPHVALRSNTADLDDATNYGYAEFCQELFLPGLRQSRDPPIRGPTPVPAAIIAMAVFGKIRKICVAGTKDVFDIRVVL